ncbi:protein 1 containing von Willebrand factor, type A domain [Sulfurimonas gotlandica GD1]|jgi:Ca-activated chloride channel family protein|uniref:Protein 1 containing von Willebrand factor, type A domain n=1 Tax=Sulfurimonas gotlandica (strain DSM 19862 / JCM 16533 / GD1) TaxID=929558 RepID=B6BMA2_SULGG|nr:VWA domain-containing protein [Sulfurimonas gotlandica]EDZ61714.1 von Willebrand factor, type A [Sulfurimonas gotlandica GD1]EHP29320.1 protein 1 containing von Willebrand factor, type A domain [Sulfurimonas gotlandica GD1]
MFDGLYFEYPGLALVFFFFIFCTIICKIKLPSIYFAHIAQFMQVSTGSSKLLLFLKWLSISMLIIALMSPVKDEPYEIEPKKGYEIALILDASESMKAKGFDEKNRDLTRFDVVKEIVSNFISSRKNDNMGIVVFGAYSFIASPLTYDSNILKGVVSNLYIGMAGKFTALFESLAQGVNLLKTSKSKTKIAILLTDGYNTPDSEFPFDAAIDFANKQGVKVYPIGIGKSDEYNQKMLEKIAEQTGGVAFGASNASELAIVYAKINELEKSEIDNETFSFLRYFYIFPLLVSFFSLILYMFFRNKRGYN